jgi:polar amino acid transport system substrate-binding protein
MRAFYLNTRAEAAIAGRMMRLVPLLVALTVLAMVRHVAAASTLEEVRSGGTLLWGGDQEGGGPYVFPSEQDPSRVTGFEVDLADRLAAYLKVRAEFTQGDWNKMPDMLKARKVHIILNGYEWNETRIEHMDASIPYFVYALQLLAAKDGDVTTWDALGKPRADGEKRRVAVLGGSAADVYMRERFGDAVELVNYEGNTDALRETETGKVDATLQDTPIAAFYASRFPKLARIGEPVAKGYYVVFVRKGETDLLHAINEAIILSIRNRDIERICKKYGIWDVYQTELATIAETGKFFGLAGAVSAKVGEGELPSEETVRLSKKKGGFGIVKEYAPILLQSAGITVILAAVSFPIAILLGLLIAVARIYGPVWLARPLGGYVEFLRGTPLMLQLYFMFFFLPELGVKIPAFATGILGLAVNYSAYEAEIYRAGLQAIPRGQMEAALSLGMSRAMAIRRIIVPQAVRIVIPPVMNDFIALFKDTSVCSVITIVELTKRYSVLSMSTQATVELMIMTALLYLLMSYPMSILSRRLEASLGNVPTTA